MSDGWFIFIGFGFMSLSIIFGSLAPMILFGLFVYADVNGNLHIVLKEDDSSPETVIKSSSGE